MTEEYDPLLDDLIERLRARQLCILRCEMAFWAAMVNVSVWGSSDHAMKALGVLSWGLVAAGAWLLRRWVERRIRVA